MVEMHLHRALDPKSIVLTEIWQDGASLGHDRFLSGTMFAPIRTPAGGQESGKARVRGARVRITDCPNLIVL
jgi:hypothetical protein